MRRGDPDRCRGWVGPEGAVLGAGGALPKVPERADPKAAAGRGAAAGPHGASLGRWGGCPCEGAGGPERRTSKWPRCTF